MFVRPIQGGDQGILRVLEGKLARMNQGLSTIWIEWIPVFMQEFVVGIPTTWIRLLRIVFRAVLFFKEAEEAAAVEDVEDQA